METFLGWRELIERALDGEDGRIEGMLRPGKDLRMDDFEWIDRAGNRK